MVLVKWLVLLGIGFVLFGWACFIALGLYILLADTGV